MGGRQWRAMHITVTTTPTKDFTENYEPRSLLALSVLFLVITSLYSSLISLVFPKKTTRNWDVVIIVGNFS